MNYKSEAATVRQPQQCTSGVTCEAYSSLSITHINQAYNVLDLSGQRIASFIHEAKAISYAKGVQNA